MTASIGVVLTLNSFEKGRDGRGPSECDNAYHSDGEMVVALSTGWFAGTARCGRRVRITAGNGRTAYAKVTRTRSGMGMGRIPPPFVGMGMGVFHLYGDGDGVMKPDRCSPVAIPIHVANADVCMCIACVTMGLCAVHVGPLAVNTLVGPSPC
uniref:Uncharacterized protein n=1 Tax=Oryza brachyantha TaxID=4533 RepID=J3N3M5_ORYBR